MTREEANLLGKMADLTGTGTVEYDRFIADLMRSSSSHMPDRKSTPRESQVDKSAGDVAVGHGHGDTMDDTGNASLAGSTQRRGMRSIERTSSTSSVCMRGSVCSD